MTVQEIEYLLSLPRVVAKDDDGNEAMLNSGPYGFYINYKGQNHKCYKVPFNMSEDEAWALIGRRKEASSSAIQYADYQGRPLSVRRGRYGLFLKWGDENIRLPKREDQSFSQEELEALCDAAAQKKDDADTPSKDGTVVASLDGAPITVHSGRYGAFLKWQGANFRINSEEPVTAELAIASVKAGLDKKKGDVVLGELDGAPVSLAHGRYGAYLKWKGSNHRLPRGMDAPSFDDAKRVLQEEAEARKQSDVVIGEYEGKPVLTAHGRFGYYLKWDGRNIALGAAYKNDVASLTLEDADGLNAFRGNIYTTVVRDEDGLIAEKDSLGRIRYREFTDEELAGRSNFQRADNRNYLDGDYESALVDDWLTKPEGDDLAQSTTSLLYEYGTSSLISDKSRVIKGGSWKDRAYYLSAATRRYMDQDKSASWVGFRCAMARVGSANGGSLTSQR